MFVQKWQMIPATINMKINLINLWVLMLITAEINV